MGITCDGPIVEDTGLPVCPYDPGELDFDCAHCWLDEIEEEEVEEPVPNPGSDLAVGQGCLCPTPENNQGQGFSLPGRTGPSFVINQACPLHGWDKVFEAEKTSADWGE